MELFHCKLIICDVTFTAFYGPKCYNQFMFLSVRLSNAIKAVPVPGYLTEAVITRFHFSVPITRKWLLKIKPYKWKSLIFFILLFFLWETGILRVIFNIEAGNYYSKSTFIMTLIKQEKLVFMLVILYIREYLCVFTKLFMGTVYPKISNFEYPKNSNFGCPVPEITDNAQP